MQSSSRLTSVRGPDGCRNAPPGKFRARRLAIAKTPHPKTPRKHRRGATFALKSGSPCFLEWDQPATTASANIANSTVFVFFGTPLAPQSRCWLRYLSAQHYTHPKQGVPFWSMPDQSKTVNKKAFPRRCAHRTDTLDVATRFLVLPHTGPPRVCCGAAVVPIPIADLFCSDRRLRRAGTGCVERVPFA